MSFAIIYLAEELFAILGSEFNARHGLEHFKIGIS
jgi:hypothetical protein